MSSVRLVPARESLVAAVLAEIPGEGPDFSRTLVVFPGKRPAHFLRRAVALRTGEPNIPPHIFSIDTFAAFLYAERLGRRDREITAFDALAMLFDIHRSLPDPLGRDAYRTFESFAGPGMKLFEELEEAALAGVGADRLAEAVAAAGGARHVVLPEYFRRFYSAVDEEGRSTRATRFWNVARNWEALRLEEFERIILAGFFSLNGAERTIFIRAAEAENTVLLFQEGRGLRPRLERLGVPLPAEPDRSPLPHITLTSSPDAHGEVFALAARLQERLAAGDRPDERTVVVLPSAEQLMPVRHHVLPLFPDDGYNVSLGYPVAAGPLAGLLRALFELSAGRTDGRLEAQAYLQVMLHPYVKGVRLGENTEATRVLVHLLEDHLAGHPSRMLVTLEGLENSDAVFAAAATALSTPEQILPAAGLQAHLAELHRRLVRPVLASSTLGELASAVLDLVQMLDDRSTAARHPYFRPFADVVRDAAGELLLSRLRSVRISQGDTSASLLRILLGARAVPFPGTPLKGLQVLGFLETRNLRFDTVHLLDANDDVLPGTRDPDLLLSPGIRRALGLPDRRDAEEITAYHLDVLIRGAREVHCTFVESDRKEKSRFIEEILWERESSGGENGEPLRVAPVTYRIDLAAGRPAEIPKTGAMLGLLRSRPLGATALDTYLDCELRFHHAHLLRLSPRDDVGEEVERKDVGIVVHRILQKILGPAVGRSVTEEDFDAGRVSAIVRREFAETFGDDPFGPRLLLRRQIEKQVSRFLEKYEIPMMRERPATLLGVEVKLEAEVGGLRIRGKLDRVEERRDGLGILDYKTGASDLALRIRFDRLEPEKRESWENAIGSLQLPLYAMLFALTRGVPLERLRPAYLFLGRQTLDRTIEGPLFGEADDPALLYPAMESVVRTLAAELLDPARPFLPPRDLRRTCPGCPFTVMCGTSWVEEPRERW